MAGYINGDFNRSGNLRLSPNAGLTFTCDVFQMSANPHIHSRWLPILSPLRRICIRMHTVFFFHSGAALYLPFGLQVNTDLDFDKTSGYSNGFNSTSWLWNAQISYSVLRDKKSDVQCKGYGSFGAEEEYLAFCERERHNYRQPLQRPYALCDVWHILYLQHP